MDPAIEDLFVDEVTIEPFLSMSATQAKTYGPAVTYKAQVVSEYEKTIDANGRSVVSSARVLIGGRLHIDPRSRLTLPEGWVPRQPPIMSIRPVGAPASIDLDNTEILF